MNIDIAANSGEPVRLIHQERDAKGEWQRAGIDTIMPAGAWYRAGIEADKVRLVIEGECEEERQHD